MRRPGLAAVSAMAITVVTATPAWAQEEAMSTLRYLIWTVGIIAGIAVNALLVWFFLHQIRRDTSGSKPRPEHERDVTTRRTDAPDPQWLGERVPEWRIGPREKVVSAVLTLLAKRDRWFDPEYLRDAATNAAILVREGIERRRFDQARDVMTGELRAELERKAERHREQKARRSFGRIRVTEVRLIQVDGTGARDRHLVTACLTFRSTDFVADDRTGEPLRGDRSVVLAQEFWTFRRSDRGWRAELIQSATDVESAMEVRTVVNAEDYRQLQTIVSPEDLRTTVRQAAN